MAQEQLNREAGARLVRAVESITRQEAARREAKARMDYYGHADQKTAVSIARKFKLHQE